VSRWSFVLNPAKREMVKRWIDRAPNGYRVEISEPKRTDAQNRLLWPLLTCLSVQLKWHGLTLSPEDWKDVMTAGLKREARMVPNKDGNGFVALGMRTSTMTKAEFGELVELVYAFGAQNGVDFDTPTANQTEAA
jgi:hypothetical protein